MNPLEWKDFSQRLLDPGHLKCFSNGMENVSGTNDDREYSRGSDDEPQSSMRVNVGWKGLDIPSRDFYMKEGEVEDPDGEPLEMEMDEVDEELARKRKELEDIEERILHKKVAIALKKVEPQVLPGFPRKNQSTECNDATLKDRVNVILLQRHGNSSYSVPSPKKRRNSSSRNKDSLLQEDHPLKLRVKTLMKKRCCYPGHLPLNREVADVAPPPSSHSISLPAVEEDAANQGFQRFLNILNKGVDIDLLTRIVNNDGDDMPSREEILNTQLSAVEDKSNKTSSQRQQTNGGERETGRESPNHERSINKRTSLPDDHKEEKIDNGCISRTKFPQEQEEEEGRMEEKTQPGEDKQHEHLQNILQTLGLSLEAEEMSKLADRTKERLYGKKHVGMKVDSREDQEIQQVDTLSHSGQHSFSTSSSISRSLSSSPSCHRRSLSRDSQQKRMPEPYNSTDRRDGLTCQDGICGKEAQIQRDIDEDRIGTSIYQHPYPQHQVYPSPHPDNFSTFPECSLPQYSQYSVYHSGACSSTSYSYYTDAQGAIPPTPNPSRYPEYTHFPPSGSAASQNMFYPKYSSDDDTYLLLNPDLATSEGQTGQTSGPRCLQSIITQPQTRSFLHKINRGPAQQPKRGSRRHPRQGRTRQPKQGPAQQPKRDSIRHLKEVSAQRPEQDSTQQPKKRPAQQPKKRPAQQPKKGPVQQPPKQGTVQQPEQGTKKIKKKTWKEYLSICCDKRIESLQMKRLKREQKRYNPAGMQCLEPAAEEVALQSFAPDTNAAQCWTISEINPETASETTPKTAPEIKPTKNEKEPTEEEIMANLRKKLDVFNQKMKSKVVQPATFATSLTD